MRAGVSVAYNRDHRATVPTNLWTMPESLVVAYIERELMSPPPQVSSRAKNKEFKQTGKYSCT
jgi:hypothetical protein